MPTGPHPAAGCVMAAPRGGENAARECGVFLRCWSMVLALRSEGSIYESRGVSDLYLPTVSHEHYGILPIALTDLQCLSAVYAHD